MQETQQRQKSITPHERTSCTNTGWPNDLRKGAPPSDCICYNAQHQPTRLLTPDGKLKATWNTERMAWDGV